MRRFGEVQDVVSVPAVLSQESEGQLYRIESGPIYRGTGELRVCWSSDATEPVGTVQLSASEPGRNPPNLRI